MVSMCLPSDALFQHLPSYLGFSYLGRGASLHSCSSKAQLLLLTLDEGYLLTAALPDLQRGIAPLGPPAPAQPLLLGGGVASLAATPDLYKKDLHDQNNHDGVITHLEPDILECEVKWPRKHHYEQS